MDLKRIRTVLLILIALSLISFSVYALTSYEGLTGDEGMNPNYNSPDYRDSVCSGYSDVGFCWEYFDSRDYFPDSSKESARFEKGAIKHVIENGGSIVVNEHHEITLADGTILILEPGDILKVISHIAYGFRSAKTYIRNLYQCMADLPLPKSMHTFA